MTPMQVDAVMERYGPPATIEIPPWIADARLAIGGAVGRLLELDDAVLAQRWLWRDDREGDVDARYAFFRCIETLEGASVAAARATGEGGPDAARRRSLRPRHDGPLGPAWPARAAG